MAALIPALIKLAMSGGFRGRGGGGGGYSGGGRSSGGSRGGYSRQPREPKEPKDPDEISMDYVDKNARKELINPGAPVDYSKMLKDLDSEIDNLHSVLRSFGAD